MCVAVVPTSVSGCVANPPPPRVVEQDEGSLEDLVEIGDDLGLDKPRETDERKQVTMTTPGGCDVYISKVPDDSAPFVVTVNDDGRAIRFDAVPAKDEFYKRLTDTDC